jgi:NADPH:quinone reductase-like Zn-dependent oxidoreductase
LDSTRSGQSQKWAALPFSYPGILGVSFAGTVERIGPSVSSVDVGDRVVVSKSHKDDASNGFSSYQKYALARVSRLAKLDPSTSFDEASVASGASSFAVLEKLTMAPRLAKNTD